MLIFRGPPQLNILEPEIYVKVWFFCMPSGALLQWCNQFVVELPYAPLKMSTPTWLVKLNL